MSIRTGKEKDDLSSVDPKRKPPWPTLRPICICIGCGWILNRATRDDPCPVCGGSSFTVRYEETWPRLPDPTAG
ncbi:MAG: hypothetical protein ACE5KU_00305 [Nitrososphaerales archaeon]